MVVYAEYLFLENFITGLALLYFTARLTAASGEPAVSEYGFLRLLAGGVLCGLGGFFLFLPAEAVSAVLLRAAAAGLVCLVSFTRQNLLKRTLVFLLLSFLSGGAAMAFFLWQQIPALAGNGVLYLEAMTYVKLAICGLPAMALTFWFVRLVKTQREADFNLGEVELQVGEKICRLMACVDTGNSLQEPVTGRPVILIDQKGSGMLPFCMEDWPERFLAVPYETVGVKRGLLTGIRLDRIRFRNREYRDIILAEYEGRFEGFEVLLNRQLLEGGLLEHGECKRQRRHERKDEEILPDAAADADAGETEGKTGETVLYRGQ